MKKSLFLFALITVSLFSCQYLPFLNSSGFDLIPYMAGDKWGFIDDEGKIIINPQFLAAGVFQEDVALVASSEGKYGFIGKDGKYVVNPTYKSASSFSEGLACVVPEDGKPQYIDKTGNVKFTVNEGRYSGVFNDGLALVGVESKEGVKWGYIDQTGKMAINAQFDAAGIFSEGLAAVAMTSKENGETLWGFIDKNGTIVVNYQFKGHNIRFANGLALVSDGKKQGYVDKNGKYVINPQFDNAGQFKDGLAAIRQGDMCGFIDSEGKIVINPQFNRVENFSGGLAAVSSSDGKYGYIDEDGKYVINPQFERASDFFGSIAFVRNADKWGIIDKDGKYVVNPQFDAVNYDIERLKTAFVESDYFDVASVARDLLDGTDEQSFRHLNTATSVGQLKADFADLSISSYDWSAYSNYNITVNDNAVINRVQFTFNESPTAGQQPVYRTQQTYDYWKKGYVNKQVLDHYESIPNDNAMLRSVTFQVQLTGNKAQAKSEKIFSAIFDEIAVRIKGTSAGDKVENQNMSVLVSTRGNTASYQVSFTTGDEVVGD